MKDRITKIISDNNLTATRFADTIGVQRSSISHIISGRNKPSYDFILKIIEKFPEISIEWLITGKGEQYKDLKKEETYQSDELLFEKGNKEIKNSEGSVKETYKIEGHKQNLNMKDKFTNVNNAKNVIILYEDGTFTEYKARKE